MQAIGQSRPCALVMCVLNKLLALEMVKLNCVTIPCKFNLMNLVFNE